MNTNVAKTLLIVVLMLLALTLLAKETQKHSAVQYCERCARLEKAVLDIMYVIEETNPDYVMDILCETDEWCVLEELVGPIPPVIPDSVHKKMKQVFPDIPANRAKPDRPLNKVGQNM